MTPEQLSEYEATLSGAAYRRQDFGVLDVAGERAEPFLQGQLTQDIAGMAPGTLRPASGLSPHGKILYVARVLRLPGRFRLFLPGACLAAARDTLRKFAVFDRVETVDRSSELLLDATYGPAFEKLSEPAELLWLPGEGEVHGWMAVPVREADAFERRLALSAVALSEEVAEVRRIEAGRPLYGVDFGAGEVPDEVGMDEATSPTKGCYVGQEVVARMRTYGRPAKKLVGFRLSAERDVHPSEELISAPGQAKRAGYVTSVARSPRAGPIALGYAVRGVYESPGTVLHLKEGGGTATLVPLPILPSSHRVIGPSGDRRA